MKRERFFTLPNIITLSRIALLPPVLYLINKGLYENLGLIFALLLIQGISDFLDGFIARKYDSVTKTGKLLDPFADKITFDFIMLFLIKYGFPKIIVVLFFIRDIVIAAVSIYILKRYGDVPKPNIWGKISTFLAIVFILSFIMLPQELKLIFMVPLFAALGISGVSYMNKTIRYFKGLK